MSIENGSGKLIVPSDSVREQSLNGWKLNVSDKGVVLPESVVTEERAVIADWLAHSVREPTWVQETYKVPSLIVRIDGTRVGQKREVYEVEERPGWIGLSNQINPVFAEKLDAIRQGWPKDLVILRTPESKTHDDHLWTDTAEDLNADANHVLLRVEPSTPDIDKFVSRSVSSVRKKGDKSYGLGMGLWESVDSQDELEEVLERGHSVLKPKKGSKLDGIKVFLRTGHPVELESGVIINNKTRGASTANSVRNTFEQRGAMYAQEFHPPMPGTIGEKDVFVAHRTYWGLDTSTGQYEPLGGLWMARPNLLLHGASDTVIGPIQNDS